MTTMFNNSSQSVAPDGTVELTNIANQKGCSTTSVNNGISILQSGIYDIYATISFIIDGGGIGSFAIKENGETITYLQSSSYSATGEPASITLVAPITVNPNCCAVTTNVPSNITISNIGTTTATVNNVTLSVVKR